MSSTVNERLKEIAKELFNSNINEMCKQCNIKQATMSNIVSGRMSKPSFEVMQAIVVGTNVNPQWLLTGEGPMFKTNTLESDRDDEAGNMDAHVGSELNYRLYYSMESIIDSIKNGDTDDAKQNVRLDDLLAVFAKETSPELQRLFVRILISTSDKLSLIRTLRRRVAELEQQVARLEARLKQQ